MGIDVSIIMINYKTYCLTRDALQSIFKFTFDINFEILLVDNASNDGSVEKLKEDFENKEVHFILNDDNLGTSKAFNIAAKNAKGKYVLWLNTDILLKDNFIKILFDFMEENSNCGICGGNLVDAELQPIHSFKRYLPSIETIKKEKSIFYIKRFNKNNIKKSLEYNFTDSPMEVGYITGADMMIRASLFNEIGYFNEDIFMYSEETEFTFRMKKQTNYKVYSVPKAQMIHLEGASISLDKKFNMKRYNLSTNGLLVYLEACYGKESVITYLKLCLKEYKKFLLISKLLFIKNKKAEYKAKIEYIKQRIIDIRMEI